MENRKLKKYLLIALKVILFVVMAYLIYIQINSKSGEIDFIAEFKKGLHWQRLPLLLAILACVPLNWFAESVKWRLFVKRFQPNFDKKKSLRSVIIGSFFGFVTPNRVGEFAGRLYGIEKENWGKGFAAGYWGGAAQFFVTFSIGAFMGWRTLLYYLEIDAGNKFVIPGIILYALGILLAFFCMKTLIAKVQKFSFLKKFTKKYRFDFDMPFGELIKVLFLTITRYSIYVTQYCMALHFFGLDLPFMDLYSSVSTMLLVHTCIPSLPFVDLGVKGNALMLIMSSYTPNQIAILMAILLIWLINIVSPAIVGYFFFAKVKAKRKEAVEE
ncbi:MAG: lysylphosphatidylglycerol synthase domain-containing protein [Chitinophagales bacterium]